VLCKAHLPIVSLESFSVTDGSKKIMSSMRGEIAPSVEAIQLLFHNGIWIIGGVTFVSFEMHILLSSSKQLVLQTLQGTRFSVCPYVSSLFQNKIKMAAFAY